ncbi:MAG: DUF2442 domain-containing protein [Chthoniobacteraceae bacterium]|jgi:hypothetical protein
MATPLRTLDSPDGSSYILLRWTDMKNCYEEKVSGVRPLDGRRIHVVFSDSFEGEVDLSPLVDKGPSYEPLRTDENFGAVAVEHGVPTWPGDFDLSPGTLRVWCEAGPFMDWEGIDQWVP